MIMREEIIVKLIQKIPGISYNDIVRKTGLSNGVISHYLIKLMKMKKIEKEGVSRGKYFDASIPKKDRMIIILLRNKTNNDVFNYIMEKTKSKEIVTANEITKKVKKSSSTISVSLRILQKNNIIERVIMNKNEKLSNDLGHRLSNSKVWANYIVKYNL